MVEKNVHAAIVLLLLFIRKLKPKTLNINKGFQTRGLRMVFQIMFIAISFSLRVAAMSQKTSI